MSYFILEEGVFGYNHCDMCPLLKCELITQLISHLKCFLNFNTYCRIGLKFMKSPPRNPPHHLPRMHPNFPLSMSGTRENQALN
jgi:hypothetical protein